MSDIQLALFELQNNPVQGNTVLWDGKRIPLDEAIKWGRRTLWDRHRKLVQDVEKGTAAKELTGPRVSVVEYKVEQVYTVYPWDVTDEDKKQESGE